MFKEILITRDEREGRAAVRRGWRRHARPVELEPGGDRAAAGAEGHDRDPDHAPCGHGALIGVRLRFRVSARRKEVVIELSLKYPSVSSSLV